MTANNNRIVGRGPWVIDPYDNQPRRSPQIATRPEWEAAVQPQTGRLSPSDLLRNTEIFNSRGDHVVSATIRDSTISNARFNGTTSQPISDNLDIHPKHGGAIPPDILNAVDLLRNWMITNECQMLKGMRLDVPSHGKPPEFKSRDDALREAQERARKIHEEMRQQARDAADERVRLHPSGVSDEEMSAAFNRTIDSMRLRQHAEMLAVTQPIIGRYSGTSLYVDEVAQPFPNELPTRPRADTSERAHRWGQPDRTGHVTCLGCGKRFASYVRRPARGCDGSRG